jgi:hypothetical protein
LKVEREKAIRSKSKRAHIDAELVKVMTNQLRAEIREDRKRAA